MSRDIDEMVKERKAKEEREAKETEAKKKAEEAEADEAEKTPEKYAFRVKYYNYRRRAEPMAEDGAHGRLDKDGTVINTVQGIIDKYTSGHYVTIYGKSAAGEIKKRNEAALEAKMKQIARSKTSKVVFENGGQEIHIERLDRSKGGRRKTRKTRGMTKRKTLRHRKARMG